MNESYQQTLEGFGALVPLWQENIAHAPMVIV
jgi:hypothetical protein